MENSIQPVVLLFDIDGTLIDSSGAGGAALLAALKREFALPDARPVGLHGRTDLGIFSELLETHGIEPSELNLQRLSEVYFENLPSELQRRGGRTLAGVNELLDRLEQTEACHLGILTGNMPESARMKLEHYQLWSYFGFGIYGDLAAHRPLLAEPAIDVIAKHHPFFASEGVSRDRIIIIGDTPLDVELANAMGVRSLAVSTGGFSLSELEDAGASHAVADLSDTDSICDWFLLSA